MAKKTLPTKQRIFNLLKPYVPPSSSWDRVYDWLLNRARIIMVFAEIIVVAAFVGKVVVDVQAKNLTEQVESNQAELNRFAQTIEKDIRRVQQKADAYQKIWNGSSGYSDVLAEIHSFISNPSAEVIIRFDGPAVVIRGGTSFGELEIIEAQMRTSTTFTGVTLPTLSAESSELSLGEGQYVFTATIAGNHYRDPIGEDGS